ncbi:penicillin-binding transpeptidase domain-containing protein [Aurantivibrio infirmus]
MNPIKKSIIVIVAFSLQSCVSINDTYCHQVTNKCTFVLYSENINRYTIVNQQRAEQQFTPASTFKIANTLIALETKIVDYPDAILKIDMLTYPPQTWWQSTWDSREYDLRNAFQNSVLPLYRGIASEIGEDRMALYLSAFNYGNHDISSGIDIFWLNGSLQISALEQVEFLRRVYHNDIEVRDETLEKLKKIMLIKETAKHKVFSKTGASLLDTGLLIVWQVGFVENDEGLHFFAFNLEGEQSPLTGQARTDLTIDYLKQAGVIQ